MHTKPMYGGGMQDPVWIKSLLGVHITAGATAFLMAPLALASAKGGKAHRRWGKIYFWAMAVVGSTALVLALYRPILFLALVAVFSFYAAFFVKPVLVQNLTIPSLLFGFIGMWLAAKSMWQFLHPPKEKMFWWYEHLGNMLASYIAAWTKLGAASNA
jgi:uncharacterized membrane protein